jgi:outer membrane protein assembly factor BamB
VTLGQLTTYDYNNARSGLDSTDPSFAHLVHAWTDGSSVISGGIYGQPLVYGDLVIVATESDDIYALDAATGKVAWHFSIGTPARVSVIDTAPTLSPSCGDIDPLGITGTPVIDPKTSEVFVAGEVQTVHTSDWQGIKHVMVGARFSATSATVLWDHQIDPPGADSTYYIPAEQQRPALTLSQGRVYAEFGGLAGDCGDYQGYVVSEPESGVKSLESFKVPTTREGAIWATGGAATSASGELYVATGNAAHGPGKPFDYGDAVVGLSPSLKIDSYWAPSDWAQRSAADLDLGSAGPIFVDGGSLVFEIGKGSSSGVSMGYLLDAAKLGGIGHSAFARTVCPNDGFVFGADATDVVKVAGKSATYVFVPCPRGTVAIQVNGGSKPNFAVKWHASSGDPNGPPIVAGGLVWALCTNADGGSGSPVLYGMSPTTGKVEVTESVPAVEHFATPGAGDGMIIVSTASGVEAFKP